MPRPHARRALLAVAAMALLSATEAPARAFQQERSSHGARVRFAANTVRVHLAAPIPGLPDGGRSALRRAMDTLSSVPCAAVRFVDARGAEGAEVSVRFLAGSHASVRSIAAHTRVESDPNSGSIRGVEIELHGAHPFADATPPPEGSLDLESVLLHELGHAAGLAHSGNPGAVMRAGTKPGRVRRALHDDDIAGLCAIYPVEQAAAGSPPRQGAPTAPTPPRSLAGLLAAAAALAAGGGSSVLLRARLRARQRRGATRTGRSAFDGDRRSLS